MNENALKNAFKRIVLSEDAELRIIERCESLIKENGKAQKERPILRRFTVGLASAMCIALIAVTLPFIMKLGKGNNDIPVTDGGSSGEFWSDTREKKNFAEKEVSMAYMWPWEDMDIFEKYSHVLYKDIEYSSRYKEISSKHIEKKLGVEYSYGFELNGALLDSEKIKHEISCGIYKIKGISEDDAIAVYYEEENKYCVFRAPMEYEPPETLGEFIERYSLKETLPLTEFYNYNGISEDGKYRYLISESVSRQVWELLEACRDAEFVEKEYVFGFEESSVGFVATSEQLGTANKAFRINENGYLSTNLLEYGYCFYIGEEAAKEIIGYVKANTEGKYYCPSITPQIWGTITEIGDGYFKLDDSVSLKDPKEGMVFTVSTEDIKIKRLFKYGDIKVGSVVCVNYDGKVDFENGAYIKTPLYITVGEIIDGNIAIQE